MGWESVTVENNQYADNSLKVAGAPPGNASTITNIGLVNGQILPTMQLQAQTWTRWRVLNAAAFFFMDLTLEPAPKSGDDDEHLPAPSCQLQLLAKDGIFLPRIPVQKHRIVLPPAGNNRMIG
jgi:FtsP/CotA-like multicopper oxidase with cupredoxin domain